MTLVKACISILAHIEGTYWALSLLVGSGRKNRTSQLDVLLTEQRLPEKIESRKHYVVGAVFPFVVAFIDRGPGSLKSRYLIRINVIYTTAVNKRLPAHSGDAWVESELAGLW